VRESVIASTKYHYTMQKFLITVHQNFPSTPKTTQKKFLCKNYEPKSMAVGSFHMKNLQTIQSTRAYTSGTVVGKST
jgi:hypothetical protein